VAPHLQSAVIGESAFAQELRKRLQRIASVDVPVLLSGPTGVGKSYLARVIHSLSPRRQFPMITVNCAAIPPTLLESELFGHEKGAYTGAYRKVAGKFQAAHQGTLFLDEVVEMSTDMQAKLLTVLEEKKLTPLGSTEVIQVDVRLIAATNKSIHHALAQGELRADLYYRLNTFHIHITPLSERPEDIIPTIIYFKAQLEQQYQRRLEITPAALEFLASLPWPGNLREIIHFLERLLISDVGKITPRVAEKFIENHIENGVLTVNKIVPLKQAVAAYIKEVVAMSNTKAEAARLLEIDIKTLNKYLNHETAGTKKSGTQ